MFSCSSTASNTSSSSDSSIYPADSFPTADPIKQSCSSAYTSVIYRQPTGKYDKTLLFFKKNLSLSNLFGKQRVKTILLNGCAEITGITIGNTIEVGSWWCMEYASKRCSIWRCKWIIEVFKINNKERNLHKYVSKIL